jgi:hypothetical protein
MFRCGETRLSDRLLGVELPPEDKLLYVTRLKGALDTITDSPLMLTSASRKSDDV